MEPNMSKQTGTPSLRYRTVTASTMSSSTPGQASAPPSDSKSILDAALSEYEKKTGKPLFDDLLADKLQRCNAIDTFNAIWPIFQSQVEAYKSMYGDVKLMDSIGPMVDVLSTFSDTLGGVTGIVRR